MPKSDNIKKAIPTIVVTAIWAILFFLLIDGMNSGEFMTKAAVFIGGILIAAILITWLLNRKR